MTFPPQYFFSRFYQGLSKPHLLRFKEPEWVRFIHAGKVGEWWSFMYTFNCCHSDQPHSDNQWTANHTTRGLQSIKNEFGHSPALSSIVPVSQRTQFSEPTSPPFIFFFFYERNLFHIFEATQEDFCRVFRFLHDVVRDLCFIWIKETIKDIFVMTTSFNWQ